MRNLLNSLVLDPCQVTCVLGEADNMPMPVGLQTAEVPT